MRKFRKILLKTTILSLIISMFSSTPIKANETISIEDGIEVGSIYYTYDEQENMIENIVTDEDSITYEQAQKEYYSKFIGQAEILNETNEFIIYKENTTLENTTIEKDVYIEKDIIINTNNITINGNLYIFGTLKNIGNITVTGKIYCLNYLEQSAGEYDYGYLINENEATITCENILVDASYLETGIPEIITYDLISIDDNGVETTISKHELYQDAISKYNENILLNPKINYAIKSNGEYFMIKYAVVLFKKIQATNSSGTTYIKTTNYKNVLTGASGYTHVLYGVDAAYLDSTETGIEFKLSGVTGVVDPTLVDIVPYIRNTTFLNTYIVSNGNIYHRIKDNYSAITSNSYPSVINFGPAPSYLKTDVKYYSYDGHYFYEDYFTMIDDYRNDTNENAVNNDNPYYNYYQYLPFHSSTNYTAEEINAYIASKYSSKPTSNVYSDLKKTESLLYGEGQSFLKGNEIGVNPLLTLGIALNESGWGRSQIAITKNNLFGLNAIDSSAQESANKYNDVAQCIEVFMIQYITHGYLDTKNDDRYYGGHLGDKESGINVKYASDPYWGEKAAAHVYELDNKLGKKDVYYYSIGIKETTLDTSIYKETNTSSNVIYKMTNSFSKINIKNLPTILVNTSNDGNWYKIYTDHLLDENQDRIYRKSGQTLSWLYSQIYNFETSFGYVETNSIRKINEGRYIENFEPNIPDVPEVPEVPEVTYEVVDEIVYATENVNIRKGPGTDYDKLGLLSKNNSIQRIGIGSNGWSKVIYNGEVAYIISDYISTTNPNQPVEPEIPEIPEEPKPEPYDIHSYLSNAKLTVNNENYVFGIGSSKQIENVISELSKVDSNVKVSINSNGHNNSNNFVSTDMKLVINSPDEKTYEYVIVIKGDVNYDGKVSSMDYVLIKNHILKISTIDGSAAISANVNMDNKISSMDYVLIKNHILKISTIE